MKKYIIAIASMLTLVVSAQDIHTGYYSKAFILQSSANPATFPEANLVIGFPGLSNGNFGLQWPLSLNEILEKGSDDSLRVSLPFLTSNLKEQNALFVQASDQLFHIGFKVGKKKKVFAYLGDEIVADFGLQLSNDLFEYLTKGNGAFLNQQMDFNEESFEASVYNSFYVGAAVDVNEQLNVGARLKYLTGIANVHTERMELGFYTDSTTIPMYQTTLTSDILIQASGRGMAEDTLDFDPMLNTGLAFDFGATYQYNDEFLFSLAINDIGSITWAEENSELYTTEGETEFVFDGLTQSSAGAENLEEQMEEIADSLSNAMELVNTSGAYTTKLNPSVFLGTEYTLSDKHHFSVLFHTRKRYNKRFNVYSLGYQYQLAKSFELLASYQNYSGISNIGGGFVWTPGPLQMHMIVENMLVADVFDAKNFSLQLGLSLHFGRKKSEETM